MLAEVAGVVCIAEQLAVDSAMFGDDADLLVDFVVFAVLAAPVAPEVVAFDVEEAAVGGVAADIVARLRYV